MNIVSGPYQIRGITYKNPKYSQISSAVSVGSLTSQTGYHLPAIYIDTMPSSFSIGSPYLSNNMVDESVRASIKKNIIESNWTVD